MKQVRAMEEQLAGRILAEADVITCTLVGARNPDLGGMRFATCIIDEAAQALDPAIWIPIMRSERTIVAGDPCQLPPTVLSQQREAGLLGTTLLERLVDHHPERVALLSEQYRMNTVIMGFSNKMFYGDKVTSHPSVENRTFPSDRPLNESLLFIDTAGTGWAESAGEGLESLQNEGEAALVERVIVDLRKHEELESMSVGVISPYRGQVRALSSLTASNINVQTVDSFQGSECDIIIISLVRSNSDGDIGFLKDTRRMNVAMTRARRKLVVIGDSATISNHAFYRDFIEYAETKGKYISAWSLE
jgi:predicted DNA helicase